VSKAPDYQWVCQRCKADNAAQTRTCAECGFSAAFTVAELAEVQGQMKPVGFTLVDVAALVGVLVSLAAWYALFHNSPLIMFLGFKLFVLCGVILGAMIFLLLKAAYNFIAALLER